MSLKEWIKESNNIVFFGGAGVFQQKAIYQISEVIMVYIKNNTLIQQK